MPIKDIFLPLVGEPSAAAMAAIDKCVALASKFGARISALALEEEIQVRPKVVMSADLDNATTVEAVRSVTDAQGLLTTFDCAAARFSVRNERKLMRVDATDAALTFAEHARLKDLSLVSVNTHDNRSEKIVEHLLFKSGRPVLMCPEKLAAELPVVFNHVLMAWDHSAPAARAIADALPMLKSAATLRIITATDQKTPDEMASGTALVDHLVQHGVKASFEAVPIDGSSIGKVFEADVRRNAVDLLIMGAYRHSRLNEMIWGGATKTIIGQPPCWVMMSR